MRRVLKFTLLELLLVIAVIMILMAILLPALKKTRETSKTIACSNNLKQVGLGLTFYSQDWNGYMPRASDTNYSWHWILYNNGCVKIQKIFACPVDTEFSWQIWGGGISYGMNQYFVSHRRISMNSDPSSLMILSDADNYRIYKTPPPTYISNRHPRGANVLFCDLHIKSYSESEISASNWWGY